MQQIHIFGDSILKGVTYDAPADKYRLIKEKLQVPGYEVYNHCKMGATVEQTLGIIRRHRDACDGSAVAVIEIGGNDCSYRWDEVAADPAGEHRCLVEPEPFCALLRQAIDLCREQGARVVLTDLPPISSRWYFDFIARERSGAALMQWLGRVERLGEWHDHYDDLVHRVAREADCPVLSLQAAFPKTGCEAFLCVDGIHPTPEGHRRLQRAFAEYFAV